MRIVVSPKFWDGRRVFVTGHTGFKGGWLVAVLNRLGAKVSGYSLAPITNPNFYTANKIDGQCTSTLGDVRDLGALKSALEANQPEILFHLAAQAIVRRARVEPLATLSTNIIGTAHVLEALRSMPSVKAAVIVTSDKVYDNVEWPWAYRENDRLGGSEPYGVSKACAELVVEAYRRSYFHEDDRIPTTATARAGNVIGGGDWALDRIVPDAIRAFSQKQVLEVRNPAAIRPWQHVLEPLSGYMRLAEVLIEQKDQLRDLAFNFGPEASDSVPVSDISNRIAARWGDGAEWRPDPTQLSYEARLLQVDSAKAQVLLGWKPRWGLQVALERTIDWYKAFYSGEALQGFTVTQIDEYLDA
jgi:CDP-glucose 4,6-dehydratase